MKIELRVLNKSVKKFTLNKFYFKCKCAHEDRKQLLVKQLIS